MLLLGAHSFLPRLLPFFRRIQNGLGQQEYEQENTKFDIFVTMRESVPSMSSSLKLIRHSSRKHAYIILTPLNPIFI